MKRLHDDAHAAEIMVDKVIAGIQEERAAELEAAVVSGRYCSPHHPTHLNPRFLIYMASFDVASNIHVIQRI